MTHIEDVEGYLDYYLDPQNVFDFGVMLDGPWGAGKTHFVKSYLEKLQKRGRQADPLNEKPFLYVSLYGASTVGQISEQFFAQMHPILSSGAVRMLGSLAVAAVNAYTGAGVGGGDSPRDTIRDGLVKLEGKILVFDDLERCSMPIAEAMGFINAFVEHEGLKVIVVANQEEIPKPQLEDYQRKKEKLIGKTIRIASDPRAVFDVFAANLQIQAAKTCVLENKEKVLRTFEESGKQNFRSLRSVLVDFDRIVSLLGEELQGSDAALSRLLLYIVATGIEFKADALRRNDFARLSPTYFKLRISDAEDGDEKRLEEIQEKYHEVDWSDPVILPEILGDFFGSGILDGDEVRKHVAEHPLVAGPKQTPAWRQLWAWYDLPRAQYESARSKLIENLATHDLNHPGIILHAAGIVIEFAENGDHILGSRVSIPGFFKKYLKELLIEKTLVPAIEIFDF
ncbi:MAG: hypothetical protein AMXMBFR74_31370 [Parvibaculum sp.]|uniref:P-loop NTPase fold protein n=1 Tax=Parvibaculum sp. TaxID=2024848 RepID=UPI0035B6BF07